MKQNKRVPHCASKEMRSHREIVCTAIAQNGRALQYRQDKDIVASRSSALGMFSELEVRTGSNLIEKIQTVYIPFFLLDSPSLRRHP